MSVTAAAGFAAGGIASGIKASGDLDLAIVAVDPPLGVPAAATFTANRAAAAPVRVSRAHLADTGGRAAAVVLNSGGANAATGAEGRRRAELACGLVAEQLGVEATEVLVCSTGLIGVPLPLEPLTDGIPPLVASRSASPEGGSRAARAILTTDTRPKEVVVVGQGFVVGGMAKGAAMLAPNMATMLAVLTTDAAVGETELRDSLSVAVERSFNELSVDGCTSTNDTVIVLASGAAGPVGAAGITGALTEACRSLANQMAADAEGATKTARIRVIGASTPGDAAAAARAVAESQLVKCSLYGADPYWGRVVAELGSSGAAFDLDLVSVAYGGIVVCREGVAVGHDSSRVREHLASREVEIVCDLGLGRDSAEMLSVDLGPAYIDENMGTS